VVYHRPDWDSKNEQYPVVWYRQILREWGPDSRDSDINFVCPDADVVARWYYNLDPRGKIAIWEFKEGASNKGKPLQFGKFKTFETLNRICVNSTEKDRWLGVTLFWCLSWKALYEGEDMEITANNEVISKEHFIDILQGKQAPPRYPFFI